jgi:hypothetical protein
MIENTPRRGEGPEKGTLTKFQKKMSRTRRILRDASAKCLQKTILGQFSIKEKTPMGATSTQTWTNLKPEKVTKKVT